MSEYVNAAEQSILAKCCRRHDLRLIGLTSTGLFPLTEFAVSRVFDAGISSICFLVPEGLLASRAVYNMIAASVLELQSYNDLQRRSRFLNLDLQYISDIKQLSSVDTQIVIVHDMMPMTITERLWKFSASRKCPVLILHRSSTLKLTPTTESMPTAIMLKSDAIVHVSFNNDSISEVMLKSRFSAGDEKVEYSAKVLGPPCNQTEVQELLQQYKQYKQSVKQHSALL